ncbi:MAG: RtcB family protein [Rhodocyclaceae bacterium]|nr:RtcB family protein [Rhodocyclaceae bacterium]
MASHELIETDGVPIRAWIRGVQIEDAARKQLLNVARLPFVFRHVAAMPDVHWGMGATVGSVIPTLGAIVPAAVGVDIGCGMMAVETSLRAADLPDNLHGLRTAIEAAVPHGRTNHGGKGDRGAWHDIPKRNAVGWQELAHDYARLAEKHPKLGQGNDVNHLGTLGTGNHFIEVCLDEADKVWFMLHSGSRGVGNAIGNLFIELAQADMRQHIADLPHRDLAYFREGSEHFDDYVAAVGWAQDFARQNREVMMAHVIGAARQLIPKTFSADLEAVNCHHNYVQRETHFGEDVLVTRKGAVAAHKGLLGIIPGSMGAKSFIVRGLGNEDAFCSCSHGAGRTMSRTQAKKRFSIEDQIRATHHVECRKDADVIDEIPMAYKDIDAVMAAQETLVEVVHTLRQVVCVKG